MSILRTRVLLFYLVISVCCICCIQAKKCHVKGEFPTPFPQTQSHYFIGVFLVHMTMLSLNRCFWSRIIFCFKIRLLWQLIRALADVLILNTLLAVCPAQPKETIPFAHGITNAAHWQKEWDASLHVQHGPNRANWIVSLVWKWIHRRVQRVNVQKIHVSPKHVLVARCVSWRTMSHVAWKVDVDWLLNASGIHRYRLHRLWNRITVRIIGQAWGMAPVAIWSVTNPTVIVSVIKNAVLDHHRSVSKFSIRTSVIALIHAWASVIAISAAPWVYWCKAVVDSVNVHPTRVWDTLVQQGKGVRHFQPHVIIIVDHHPARIYRLACDEITIRLSSTSDCSLCALAYLLIILILNFQKINQALGTIESSFNGCRS